MLSHSIRLTWPSGSGPGIPPSSVIHVSKSQCRMRRSGAEADRSGVGILQMKDLTFTMSPVAINVLKLRYFVARATTGIWLTFVGAVAVFVIAGILFANCKSAYAMKIVSMAE